MGAQAKVINFSESSPLIKFEINGREYIAEYGSVEIEKTVTELQEKLRELKRDADSSKYIKAVDAFIDGAFGEGSAAEIFADYPNNTYVRAIVVDGVYEAFAESDQKAKVEAITSRFVPDTINDGTRN